MYRNQAFFVLASLMGCFCSTGSEGWAKPVPDNWQWSDILEPPLIGPEMSQCSKTHPVRAIPEFGDGLIATYSFRINDQAGDPASAVSSINRLLERAWEEANPVRPERLAFPDPLPHGPTDIAVDSNAVLTNLDDLLSAYAAVCQSSREPGLRLTSISYRRATIQERAEAPRRKRWYVGDAPFPPVLISPDVNATDILPEPVAHGNYEFSAAGNKLIEKDASLSENSKPAEDFDPARIERGAGLHIAALYAGYTSNAILGYLVVSAIFGSCRWRRD